jgi:SAM-dependent methyltransferase
MLPELTTSAPDRTEITPELTFARRAEPAELPELMDAPCSYETFRDFLRDLAEVNRVTRAYAPTLAFFDRIVDRTPGLRARPLRILDVGSGGGDMLRAVARWSEQRNIAVSLSGVDLNPHAALAARELSAKDPLAAHIEWHTGDVFTHELERPPDVVISALFTHHLSSPEIVRFLGWMEQHARLGWFINDLHRSRSAAFWFRLLPVLFGWHPFIRNDGPVSLRRAFVPGEWKQMLAQANISDASVEQHLMNRLCVARIR